MTDVAGKEHKAVTDVAGKEYKAVTDVAGKEYKAVTDVAGKEHRERGSRKSSCLRLIRRVLNLFV